MDYGCIGKKLGHSFSAVIHHELGDYDYRLVELSEQELEKFMTEKAFKAINVTIPYKQAVIPYLDKVDFAAQKIGAVNTIVNNCGVLTGYNTDFYGMTQLLKRGGIELLGKNVFILGTGGTSKTARAVAEALEARKIYTVSRKPSDDEISYGEMYSIADEVEVIINTTPVGMYPNNGAAAVEPEKFPRLCGVADAVYNPLTTALVKKARACGARAVNGLYMLVAQAAKAAEYFFDNTEMIGKTDAVYEKIYRDKLNLILIGMPASGKSSIGRLVAQKLGRPFYDTDDAFVEENGNISEFFSEHGEAAFRQKETEIVKRLGALNGAVIATGGGAVLKKENIDALKQNGVLTFLDRELSLLMPTSDRPLGNSREAIEARYKERYPIYTSVADISVPSNSAVEKVAEAVIKGFDKFSKGERI